MPVIDADAHVIETEDTWAFMEPGEEHFRPISESPENPDESAPSAYWRFDGIREPRMVGNDEMTGTSAATRELRDVGARVRHMGELGIDVQVLYPTVLLQGVTSDPQRELALRRSYNRWLAQRCASSKGRLKWVCAPPIHSMDKALAELRFAKENGACGVLKKADLEALRWPNDPYFFPLYEEAQRLDMPVCFHTGTGIPENLAPERFLYGRLQRLTLPVASAAHSMVLFEIPARFPKLRFGFIEAGAAWLPFIVGNLKRRAEKIAKGNSLSFREFSVSGDILRENRIFVSCFVDEDLPYLMRMFGADNLVAGSDYGHADPARENGFVERLHQRVAAGEFPQEVLDKILYRNPKALYGL